MLEISYPEDVKIENMIQSIRNDNTNSVRKDVELKINGKLKHIVKATKDRFMDSILFPSGKVLKYDISENGLLLKKVEDGMRVNIYNYDQKSVDNIINYPVFKSMIGPTGIIMEANKKDDKDTEKNSCARQRKFIGKEFPRRFQEGSAEIIVPYQTSGIISRHGFANEESVEIMWDYFVQNQVLLRTFHGFSGVGKHFLVNRKRIFSSEIHPMSGIQSLYDAMGKKLIG